jgi:hypothetical protein
MYPTGEYFRVQNLTCQFSPCPIDLLAVCKISNLNKLKKKKIRERKEDGQRAQIM